MSHRALIAAGLSEESSIVRNIALSEDIIATMEAMRHFGADYELIDETDHRFTYRVTRQQRTDDAETVEIYCNESGSTARFLIPFFHLLDKPALFTGAKGLSERPFDPYFDIFDAQGVTYSKTGNGLPLTVSGKLQPGTFELVGNVSSQFVTGLLYILPLLNGDSELVIKPPFESKDYVALTLEALSKFGIVIEQKSSLTFYIRGNQKYRGTDFTVEGDFSQAAFWLVANALGSEIELEGLPIVSKQADRVICEMIEKRDGSVEFDVSECPDLLPILSVLLALTPGKGIIVGGKRVRIKESDRIKAMACELSKMGAVIEENFDGLTIRGIDVLSPAIVESWNDHRIAMALAIASTCAFGETKILSSECVKKSYPDFWDVFMKLGGDVIVK